MADIKQAAKWIKKHKNVRRKSWEDGYIWFTLDKIIIGETPQHDDRAPAWVGIDDLLAEDWEIVV